jgi:hypothetical protein
MLPRRCLAGRPFPTQQMSSYFRDRTLIEVVALRYKV